MNPWQIRLRPSTVIFCAIPLLLGAHLHGQAPPLAVFAWQTNQPAGSKVIDMSSGHSTITGRIHCNSDIDVSGTANYFRTGAVEHVTGIHPVPDFQGKVTLQDCPVVAGAVEPWPVDYLLSDFAPGGSEAAAASAAGKYFVIHGNTSLSSFMNNGELREGLYYVEGDIMVSKTGVRGRVTIVATGKIAISAGGGAWQAFTRCLLFYSAASGAFDTAAVNYSGGSGSLDGILFTPNAGIQISGPENTVAGALIGRGVHLTGGYLRITGMRFDGCVTAGVTNRAPIVDAGPDRTLTLPTNSITLSGTIADDGLPSGVTVTSAWTVVSAPAAVTFANPAAAATLVTFADAGTYVLRLLASDTALAASDEVVVTVNRGNAAPEAYSKSVTNLEDVPLEITLQGSDPDGDPLTFIIVRTATNGVVSGTPPNVVYTPVADRFGEDSFTFKVSDGRLESALATITIVTVPVNDIPLADAQAVSTFEDVPREITLTGSDADGDALSYQILSFPTRGCLLRDPQLVRTVISQNSCASPANKRIILTKTRRTETSYLY